MASEWTIMMRNAISDVMETMFFTMLEFDGPPPEDWHAYCQSNISVADSDQRIQFNFQVSEDFGRNLTANLLGAEETEVSPEELEDTMRELANMVAGNFIAQTPDHMWTLGLPDCGDALPPSNGGYEQLGLFVFGEHVGFIRWEAVPTGS